MISGKLYSSSSSSCIFPPTPTPTPTPTGNLHLSFLKISSTLRLISFQSVSLSVPSSFASKSSAKSTRFSNSLVEVYSYEGQNSITLSDLDDLSENGVVYKKTLAMVECSMFAALNGLVYFLSNSLALENYFGCFFCLPIVISSMRWGISAGRKTMVATFLLLLVLSGPVKALTYLAWFSGVYNGLLVEAWSKLEYLNLSLHNRSSIWSSGVCLSIFILDKREHTISDHYKYSCFPHPYLYCLGCELDPINECNICYIWDTGIPELWMLHVFASSFVLRISY
ncbi:hypothetical protein IC582_005029 [Cucumis melo]